jgi:DNA repair exonuclease SbcCD ATPase subunit
VPDQLTSVRIVKGVLHASRKLRRATEYTVKNSGDRAKQVLIEYPFDASWTLTQPDKPAEKTRDLYRFAVQAAPGTPVKLLVEEEQTVTQQTVLTNLESQVIVLYLNARVVSDPVKEALREVARRRQQLADLAAQQQRLQAEIAAIEQEQARIRQNMQQLDRTGDLYTRYVKKFGDQESQIESLRDQIQSLVAEQAKQQQSLDGYLNGLSLE